MHMHADDHGTGGKAREADQGRQGLSGPGRGTGEQPGCPILHAYGFPRVDIELIALTF